MASGTELPTLRGPVPGPNSRAWVDRLAARECPAITARRARRATEIGAADTDPFVWHQAVGANVEDVDGNVFVDLTAGFGVAAVGHRNPEVVAAIHRQADRLLHAMGDAYPDPQRIKLMEHLCERTGMDRAILGLSGSDAVEAAIKTAVVATKKHTIISFTGGYHGLASGPLAVLGYNPGAMREPFAGILGTHHRVLEWGAPLPDFAGAAAVIVEPIQGRGGMREAPRGWISEVHGAARAAGALVIHDEIFSGGFRTGQFLAAEEKPDLLCLGKAIGGGLPLSACLGTAEVMDAWAHSAGAAIHTQTFLGHPLGCAASLAALTELDRLAPNAVARGRQIASACRDISGVRRSSGRGLMLGLYVDNALAVARKLLERGYIVLPCGERAEALGITPPLCITAEQVAGFLRALSGILG